MRIAPDQRLSRLTTIGAGGPAAAFAQPESLAELEEALRWATERDMPVVAVGLGIMMAIFRRKREIDVDDLNLLRG